MKKNYIILDMEMIQTAKDHACIRKFYALNNDGESNIEIECFPCKPFSELDLKYQLAFIFCKKKIHHLKYYPTHLKKLVCCCDAKHILKNFIGAEIGVKSFTIEELGIPKANSHDPIEEVHTHYKKLKMSL